MRRLLKYARKQWKLYLTSIIFLVIGVYLNALGPKYIRDIIDKCIVGGRGDLFFSIAIPMLVVYLVTGVAKYIQEFSSDCISSAMQRCMREETFRSILSEDAAEGFLSHASLHGGAYAVRGEFLDVLGYTCNEIDNQHGSTRRRWLPT